MPRPAAPPGGAAPLSVPDAASDPPSDTAPRRPRRPLWLLGIGTGAGLALAMVGLLERSDDARTLPDGAVARVGEHVIRRVDYERVLLGVEGDLRGPVDTEVRRRVLDRMVDEELLVQRAIDLGLARIDRRVRGELTSGLIDSIVSEADARPPTPAEVARHYEENLDFFSRPGRLRARTLFFSDGEDPPEAARERARAARARLLRGEDVRSVREALADAQISPLPDALLPASKIRDYVGPGLLRTLESLEVGAWSEPVPGPGGLHLAQVIEREPRIVPPLEEVEALVRRDLERRRGDEALRRYLEELRREIPVVIDESATRPDRAPEDETTDGTDGGSSIQD